MKATTPPLSLFAYSLCAGLCLMCFALLLHPMSPDDFLALCLARPAATWESAYGIQATALFWISVVPTGVGMAGMLRRTTQAAFRMIAAARHPRAPATMHQGWSF